MDALVKAGEEIIFKKQLISAYENRNSNNTNQTPTQQ